MNSFYLGIEVDNRYYEYNFSKSIKNEFFYAEVICTSSQIELNIVPAYKIKLKKVRYVYSFDFLDDDRIFYNGYQSWTNSKEEKINAKETALKLFPKSLAKQYGLDMYGDFTFDYRIKGKKYGYTYIYVRRDNIYNLFASIYENSGFTYFYIDDEHKNIIIEKDCAGRTIESKFTALNFLTLKGEEDFVFNTWFFKLKIFKLRTAHKIGYTSWYNHYQDISEEIILKDLESMSNLNEKVDMFQIDDGYQQNIGDWLNVDKMKFPNGMDKVAEKIKDKGYTAGIWLAPFVCEENSYIYKHHKNWLLKDEEDEYYYVGCNWSGAYALDFYNEEVREYIKRCLEYYIECGYDLFKLDFLYAVCIKPRENKTRGEIMFEAMEFLNNILEDKYILGCGIPLSAAFGKVDFCRVGCDMTLDYDDKLYMRFAHAERPSTKNTMLNTIYRRQLNNRGFLSDPDVFLLRKENTKLSTLEKKNLAIIDGLFGGILFSSDNFSEYDKETKDFFSMVCNLKNATDIKIKEEKNKLIISYKLENKPNEVIIKI